MEKNYFDERQFERLREREDTYQRIFDQATEQLCIEGLPTSMEFLKKITKEEDSLKVHIKELMKQRLSGGFIPTTERSMVEASFAELYERLYRKIDSLRGVINQVIIKDVDDLAVIDWDATRKKWEKQATFLIDVEKAEEYYNVFIKAIEAWKELMKYEDGKGYIHIFTPMFHEIRQFGFTLNETGTVSEDAFLRATNGLFRK